MADSYHIIDGQVVPFHGGRKDTNTGAWRDATPLELQLQEQLAEAEREIEALRAEVVRLTRANGALTQLWESAGAEQNKAEARADRLAEALRNVRAVGRDDDGDYAHKGEHHATCVAIAERALLREQEEGRG